MTPYDQLFKILHSFKGYISTPEKAIQDITDTFLSYPGFTPESREDLLKWLNEENSKEPLDTSKAEEFPNDLNPKDK